ncbi:hypothetical protein Acor_52700 [Acrocarpospora corrugata]|uniref:Glucanase n=1 Tax=Acrocarpospora corrugata TaxID=35763 RepID=A0A5M3W363_9ACTN|nr:glycoside hydrolase family 6 protein [Acrocarpospora corrugata]GES03204.1 hypothetical protein Acor_52700 [Acrocarpospora corrugata]
MRRVAFQSTGLWLDSIAAIGAVRGGKSLRQHLDAALVQSLSQGNGDPVTVTLVLSDLPGKGCSALVSNAELRADAAGLGAYRTQFVDPIAAIVGDPRYRNLRIVAILEPGTLMSLVSAPSDPDCVAIAQSGVYAGGVRYAINKLRAVPNAYVYLDVARSSLGGFDALFPSMISLYSGVISGTAGVDGFATNVADYVPVEEIFLPNSQLTIGGTPLWFSRFFDFNKVFDELDYATGLRNAFIAAGQPTGVGVLIDTSRNGWGGQDRPVTVSTSFDLNTYVNQSRLDRRPHRFAWCNQAVAGIGPRPAAAPHPGVDAYVWAKPPGESDGFSERTGAPDVPGLRFNPECDPDYSPPTGASPRSGAMDDAPLYGSFFPAHFRVLVRNAYPAL